MDRLNQEIKALIRSLNSIEESYCNEQNALKQSGEQVKSQLNNYDDLYNRTLSTLREMYNSCLKFESGVHNSFKEYLTKPSLLDYVTIENVRYSNFASFLRKLSDDLKTAMNDIVFANKESLPMLFENYANVRYKVKYVLDNYDRLMSTNFEKAKVDEILSTYLIETSNAKTVAFIESAKEYLEKITGASWLLKKQIEDANEHCVDDFEKYSLHEDVHADDFADKILIGDSRDRRYIEVEPHTPLTGNNDEDLRIISDNIRKINRAEDSLRLEQCEYIDLRKLIENKNAIVANYGHAHPQSKENFYDFMSTFFLQVINHFPSKMVRIAHVDSSINKLTQLIAHLKARLSPSTVFEGVINTREKLTSLFGNLMDILSERQGALGFNSNVMKDIYEYNEKVEDNKQAIIFLVVNQFPGSLSREELNKINDIIENGPQVGIFTILIKDRDELTDDRYFDATKKLVDEILHKVEYCIDFDDDVVKFNGLKIRPYIASKSYDVDSQLRAAKKEEQSKDSKIYLDTLFDKEDYLAEKPYPYKQLSFPIGKSGSKPLYLNLGADSDCHMLITGTTGSGKSYLLHTLILSACYNYSPDEVNFYLMDFKDGVEFKSYSNDMKLPHIKYMALGSKPEEALDILKSLVAQKEALNELFTSASENGVAVTNIESYNKSAKVASGELPKIPHTFIVIDEFQVIVNKTNSSGEECAKILKTLAEQSRNVGYHLVFSSQKVPAGFSGVLDQVNTRICLNNQPEIIREIIPQVYGRTAELTTERGLGFLSQSQHVTLFKGAISDDKLPKDNPNSRYAIYAKIIERYKDYPIDILLSGNTQPLMFSQYSDIVEPQVEDKFVATLGKNMITGQKCEVAFNMFENAVKAFVQVGDLEKTKQVDAIFLANLAKKRQTQPNLDVTYINFKLPYSKIDHDIAVDYANENGISVLEKIDDIKEKLSSVHTIFKERKGNLDGGIDFAPIFVLVSSAERANEIMKSDKTTSTDEFGFVNSFASPNDDEFDILKLMLEGYKYSIFILPTFVSMDAYKSIVPQYFSNAPIKMLLSTKKFEEQQLQLDDLFKNQKICYGGDIGLLVDKTQVSKIRLYKREEN